MSEARATVDGFLGDLSGGDDLVLVTIGRSTTWIGLDAHLAPSWRVENARHRSLFQRRFVEEGTVRRLERDGTSTSLVRVAALDGTDSTARVLAVLDDGMIVSRGQRILRIAHDGRPLWPAVRTLPGVATKARVSGDRVLVGTDSLEYTPWGYLGPACLLRLDDGSLVRELRGEHIAALDDDGHFLLTLQGYDVFDTWLYDRDGSMLTTWRSSGHLLPDSDGTVRVIESDSRSPSSARVVRLRPDGTIERGPELRDGQSSRPLVLDDGRLVFVDGGRVRAVDRELRATDLAEIQPVEDDETWRYHARVARCGDRVIVALCERLPDEQQPQMPGRTAADMLYRCHLSAVRY